MNTDLIIDDTLVERASLFVLDLLEGDEKRLFEEDLKSNFDLQKLVDDLYQSRDLLARDLAPIPPPPDLKGRIMQAVEKESRPAKIVSFPSWIPWSMAACLAVAATGLFFRTQALESENASLRGLLSDQTSRNKQLADSIRTEYASEHWTSTSLQPLSDQVGKVSASIVWNQALTQGKLTVASLPPCGIGKDYQLWVIDPSLKAPVSAGLVLVNEEGMVSMQFKPIEKITKAAQFAISLETAGGEISPHGPILLAGSIL